MVALDHVLGHHEKEARVDVLEVDEAGGTVDGCPDGDVVGGEGYKDGTDAVEEFNKVGEKA